MRRLRFRGSAWTWTVTLAAVTACGSGAGSGRGNAASGTSAAARETTTTAAPVSGTVTGLYVDAGGAPLFTECGTSTTWRVKPGKVARSLDEAYRTVRNGVDDPARVTLVAHSSPDSTPGDTNPALVVDSVVLLTGEPACPGQEVAPPLTTTTWRAVEIEGRRTEPDQAEVTLVLDRDTKTLRAHMRCRTLTGTFRRVGTQLTFGGVESRNERCQAVAEDQASAMEATVLQLLRTTGSYQIRGDTLDLMGESGVLARFTGER